MIQESDIAPLIKQQMQRAEAEMRASLDRVLYHTSQPSIPPPPLTWRDHHRRRWNRLCGYLYTIWRALRGDDLDTPRDWDDY